MTAVTRRRRYSSSIVLCLVVGCQSNPQVTDPVASVPLAQQRVVTRAQLGWQWPFGPGVGTLACSGGAVLFRSNGVTYGLNAAARNKGGADPEPILFVDHSARPRRPGEPVDPGHAYADLPGY